MLFRSNISNGVLQGIGKPNIPMINAALALVADVIVMLILLLVTDLGVYTIVIAMIVYSIVMCVLNDLALKKYMQYVNPWKLAYIPPILASVPMALVAGGVYYLFYRLTHRNFISLVPAGTGSSGLFCSLPVPDQTFQRGIGHDPGRQDHPVSHGPSGCGAGGMIARNCSATSSFTVTID